MRRTLGYAFLVVSAILAVDGPVAASPRAQIIPETVAARHGLARPWFTQIEVDRTRGRIAHILLDRGTLFVLTDQASLQAIDAETGQTLWYAAVGRPGHPSMRPAVNQNMVAVINGSNLHILNRFNGKLLWQRQIEGAPGAGPALSEVRVYAPTTDGLLLAYRLEPVLDAALQQGLLNPEISEDDARQLELRRRDGLRLVQELAPPLACRSFGRALVQPLITRENEGEEFVAWPTDRGALFVGRMNRKVDDQFELRYKLETRVGITARPTFLPPLSADPSDSGIIFAPSRDGFVHAIRERDGSALWRFSAGEAVIEPVAPIREKVYVTTQLGGMFCLASQTGEQLWWAPGLMQFVAASQDRVYAADRQGNLVVLHGETGGRLDVIPVPGMTVKMMNLQTDRLYLASESGLLHCLREFEHEQPINHLPEPPPAETRAKPAPREVPGDEPAVPDRQPQPARPPQADPFGGAADPFGGDAGGAADPFGGGGTDPFGGAGADPFGGGGADPFGGGAGGSDPFGGGGADPFR